jgi:hypothetical protein
MADHFKVSKTGANTRQIHQLSPVVPRDMRMYQITASEMLQLSVLTPSGSALIGYGVSFLAEGSGLPDGREKTMVRFCGSLLVIIGISLILIAWGQFLLIRYQSRDKARSLLPWDRKKTPIEL